ncbi:MAG TPA: zf-HC2 domain-containing protein [Thermoanaerobaculia bacterium]|nr:zf-HC2 domain-containing protein [Thermoanaerobaculia bacterium]
MPELAPIQTQPPQGSCPSAEELSCYIDGALSPEEAARVRAHLASCESCFEVYSEVLQFQLESESEEEPGKVVRFPVPRSKSVPHSWWSVAAAVLVLGLGLLWFLRLVPPPPLETAELTAPLQGRSELSKNLYRGLVTRGSEPEKEMPFDQASFKVGVQLVNLQVSLAANDRGAAQDSLALILQLIETQPSAYRLKDLYRELISPLAAGKPPRELLPKADELGKATRESLEPSIVDFGQWVEAGRLASIAREPTFFHRYETRLYLLRILFQPWRGLGKGKLAPQIVEHLRQLRPALYRGDLTAVDFDELKGHFDKILEANYPG